MECEGTRLTDAGRKEKTGVKEKEDRKGREDQKENGQIQVTRGTILGITPIGTAREMVLKMFRGRLLNGFLISVQTV